MHYTILVTGAAYGTQNASTAFLFCKSLIKMNHVLNSVFFYCDGVLNANIINQPPIDEFNLITGWQKLYQKYSVKLYVCASAALRRGVVEDNTLSRFTKGNIAPFFQLSGLLEFGNSINISDRIIQF
ncbi:sulfurtransferase complex subunit TusD [Buchnera aphidicola (Aphis craccivora)]|uniref:Sulfurtransferase complex subunit TusD n=1 Tax=Buchnera aphidicola (Aphis craccivora) TaxID=466616 RepID=A0A4D6XK10_9GAMM|nr:sulfurtransferase complex subunit TusD [Buchnera aphidicola]QCI16753.1 sulfurtransferase complex subunit TusD [Buchnera aphidicola (Aphis craccivora)]QLL40885.1 sulfurtransferase complex subunit TusD [Buchnera aphidicola (Aphis craccivore)]WAI17727.1 MAG: sulfurtransferase complex subunit TusD [Buchnera aphidicola (Aphis craccivora)]